MFATRPVSQEAGRVLRICREKCWHIDEILPKLLTLILFCVILKNKREYIVLWGGLMATETMVMPSVTFTKWCKDILTKMGLLDVLDPTLFVCLLLFSAVVAFFSVYLFDKFQNSKVALQQYGIPLIPLVISIITVLFSDEDSYRVRIITLSILLVMYCCFVVLFGFIWNLCICRLKSVNTKTNALNPIGITLPLKKEYPISKQFVDDFPANVRLIVHVNEDIRILTDAFIAQFPKLKNDEERDSALRGYFLGICYYLATMFDRETRVHVRILKDSKYQKFISTYSNSGALGGMTADTQRIKAMSFDNKMISESFRNRCSLIKELNPSLHEEGSRAKWINYLTFALPQVEHDGKPVFSMGISISRIGNNPLLYFLNYCTIEEIVGGFIERILDDPNCRLSDFIERYYFAMCTV